jgi:uncharacterized membrane protein YvlD (DUF360 family)
MLCGIIIRPILNIFHLLPQLLRLGLHSFNASHNDHLTIELLL